MFRLALCFFPLRSVRQSFVCTGVGKPLHVSMVPGLLSELKPYLFLVVSIHIIRHGISSFLREVCTIQGSRLYPGGGLLYTEGRRCALRSQGTWYSRVDHETPPCDR